jgi:hypothetical protein
MTAHGDEVRYPLPEGIVEVLIAQRQRENPLAHQRLQLVFDKARVAPIVEADGEPPQYAQAAIDLPQQQRPHSR